MFLSTKKNFRSTFLQIILFILFSIICININAQAKEIDTTATTTPTTPVKPPKPKDIKKLEDENLRLPQELIAKIKKMGPDELVTISERFMYNDKREDESGDKYEVTITVRLGFSQDMITGIVKEVPIYNTIEKEVNIIYVKIPIQFCCTTAIDTLHKKQHCGKMSELNDLEANEYCKAWAQKDEAQKEVDNANNFAKPGSKGSKKKGGQANAKNDSTNTESFGKPVPKRKPNKKDKNVKETNADDASDSTNTTKPPIIEKNKKGKPAPVKKQNEDEEYGKPIKDNKKGKGKNIQQPTDSTNYRPEKQEPPIKEEKTKKGKQQAAPVDTTDSGGFGKKPVNNKKKKKG